MARHPMQPIVMVDDVARFKANKIVRFLIDWCAGQNGAAGYEKLSTPHGRAPDLNVIARMDFSDEDRTQLAQLIGYSVSGAGDLSYFDRDVITVADELVELQFPSPPEPHNGD